MINQGQDVPKNTIVIFRQQVDKEYLPKERINYLIQKPEARRDWFTPHFYRCLPLVIANQVGFIITAEFSFAMEWDGSEGLESLHLFYDRSEEEMKTAFPLMESHFGHGILTIVPPFTLRTPPGINLMTLGVPNQVLPNVTVMTGIVETDNLRRNFTFNLKLQMPNIRVNIPAGTPLAAFMPIPRYFPHNFELKMEEEVFSPELVEEEKAAELEAVRFRIEEEPKLTHRIGRHYYQGHDIYGNKFPDHQKP